MANEPGLHTQLVTDNAQFDRSMKRSETMLDGVERKLKQVGTAGTSTGVRVSGLTRTFDGQGREVGSLTGQLASLENNYLDVGNAASRTAQRVTQSARGFRLMRGQLYNASVQMQDFAVQVGAGTSALTAFSQNAPQFLSFLGPKAALIGAFIAALPLLKVGLESIMRAFRDFDKELEAGNKALDQYISTLTNLDSGFSGAFEELEKRIRETSVATADLAKVHEQRAVEAIKKTAEGLADANTEASLWNKLMLGTDIGLAGDLLEIETKLQGSIGAFKENREAVREFIEATRGIAEADGIQAMYDMAIRAREIFVQNVDITGQMTEAQVQFLEQLAQTILMLERMGAAQQVNGQNISGYVQYYKSLQDAAELLAKAEARQHAAYAQYYQSRISGEQFLTNELERQKQKLIDVYSEYARTRVAAEQSAEAALRLSNIDMASNIGAAALEAARLADNLGIAVSQAAALALEQRSLDIANAANIKYAGRGTTSSRPAIQVDDQGRETTISSILSDQERARNKAARGKKGGGRGKSEAEKFTDKLTQLRESLMTEEELERQSYERRSQLLEQYLKMQPEKMEEYNKLKERLQADHQKRMSEIDVYRYGTGLQKAETFFGDMAAAFSQGNEKLLKIGQAFGAAEALINAWRAYAQVLADPSVPWFAKLAKAAAVLSAGLGAVQAIKGVSSSGGSSGGGAGAAAGGGASAAPQGPEQVVSISLQGDVFSQASVRGLLEQIQKELDRGGRLVIQ